MSDFVAADRTCAAIARSQYGVFNKAQALAAGHTRDTIWKKLKSGRWVQLCPKVYLIAGTPITWETRCMAITWWEPGRVAISGESAAALYRVDGFQRGSLEASTCTSRRPHGLDVKLRRIDVTWVRDLHHLNGIAVESPRRMLLNLAGRKHPRFGKALDQVLREGRVSLQDLSRLVEEDWTTGRRGIAIMREAVLHRSPWAAPTHSEMEDLYRSLVREFDLPRPIEQWPFDLPDIGRVHFDFGYPLDNAAVEADGYAWHSTWRHSTGTAPATS